ncbi:MAG: hypothetical protein LBV06_07510 [Propionibacteriaceae bacterium]|nr:hypothetical protein [Propionibacteriaceae bacterium]
MACAEPVQNSGAFRLEGCIDVLATTEDAYARDEVGAIIDGEGDRDSAPPSRGPANTSPA